MADDLKALRCATNGEEICRVLARIESNLDEMVLCDQYIGQGLVEALRDLTSSNDTEVCSNALCLISQIVSNNPEVKPKLFKPMGFFRQLSKLCSPFENNGKHGKKSYLNLHSQAVSLIKTLVLSSECMPEVASINLIGQIIDLCGVFFDGSRHNNCCGDNLAYPPKATSYFHDLAHGRKLVGIVQEMLPEASRKVVKASQVKDIFGIDASICVLSVDLYDTTTDQDIVIREELVKEGIAWPQFLSPDKEAKMFVKNKGKNQERVWADVSVTSVIDGGHFWAQVGGKIVDEKLREITLTLQKEDQVKFQTAPDIGEVVCCKTMVGGHQDFYRGKVLQVLSTQDEIMVEIFAVDYGFKNVLAMDCVTRITPLGRKEPFQARLCCLTGVQPLSPDVKVLVNAAGALRNLAYQSNACRLQILDKNGVDVLLKLIVLPDNEVRKQAIAALLNLSVNFKTRARIGFLGGIKILLDLIQNDCKQDSELLNLAIGALRNLMLVSPINRGRMAEADGLLILTHVYFTSVDDKVKQQCLGALKNLVGNSWYLLTGNDCVDLRSVTENYKMKQCSLSTATIPAKLPSTQRRTRRLRPGEVEPQPIEKALPSHVIKLSSNQGSEPLSQDEHTDGDTDGEEKLLCPSPTSPGEPLNEMKTLSPEISSFYVRGQAMPFPEDDTHEFRHSKDAKSLSSAVIARPACAFLNAGKGGTVYLGVKKTGIISGVEISRKDRDRLRVGVDEMLGEFKPAVRYDKYQVNFVPVAEERSAQSQRKNIENIPDVFIIEVTFSKCSGTVYTTNKHRCYFRCGNTNSEYSVQDVRKWVIREQESFYNDQINILRRELSATRQKLETDGR